MASEHGPHSTPRTALLLFAAGLMASLYFLVHPWYDPLRDGSIYIATARSLIAGEGYSLLGSPFTLRPPGLPVLITPVLAIWGTDFYSLNLYLSLFGVVAVLLFFLHQQPRLGTGLALLCGLALWLNPGYQRLCTQVMSDVPGFAMLMLCLLVERWASHKPSWKREITLGLLVGLSVYLRSIHVLLVPAIALARLLQRTERERRELPATQFATRRLLAFSLVALAVVLPWNLRNAQIAAPPPPADQYSLYSYSTAMWHRDLGDPSSPRKTVGQVLRRAGPRSRQMAEVLGSRFQSRVQGVNQPIARFDPIHGAIALLFTACLLTVLIRRRAPAELFALGNVAVLSVYFGFADRLMLPVYALALGALAELARDLFTRVLGEGPGKVLTGALLVLLALIDFDPHGRWPAIEVQHRELAERSARVEAVANRHARLATTYGYHYGVYMDRPVYSLQFAAQREKNAQAVERIIDKYEIDTVFLVADRSRSRSLLEHFESRYGPGETTQRASEESAGGGRRDQRDPGSREVLWRVRER